MAKILLATKRVMMETDKQEWGFLVDKDTWLLTENESAEYQKYLADNFYDIFNQIIFVDNYFTDDKFLEEAVLEISKMVPIEKIVCLAEVDIIRSAKLRASLKLKGQTVEESIFFRNKFKMKCLAKKHEILTPKFGLANSLEDVKKLAQKFSYPLVLKPIDGRGSQNVFVINKEDEIQACLSFYKDLNVLVEEFIDGDMYHIDGFFTEGDLQFISVSKYANKCLDFVRGSPLISVTLDHDNPLRDDLLSYGKHLLKNVFPMPSDALFHIEVFYKDEQIYFCEIAARIGGGMIFKEIDLAYAVNIKSEFIGSQCKTNYKRRFEKNTLPKKVAARVMIPPREAVLAAMPDRIFFPWLKEYQFYGKLGKRYFNPTMSNQEIAFFLLEADNEKQAYQRIDELLSYVNRQISWIPFCQEREETVK